MTGATLVGIHRVPQRDDDQEGLDRWPTLCSVDATPEEQKLRSVSGRRKRLAAQIKDVRVEEREAILAAHHSGMKQVQICRITGFTRDYVRRITDPKLTPAADDSATGT
jgi:DNA-directed RNA polymerase specialized sigma24 family protein